MTLATRLLLVFALAPAVIVSEPYPSAVILGEPYPPVVILSEPHPPAVILSEPRSGESKDLPAPSTDGKALYARCVACHQADGAGVPGAFPPLTGSEFVLGKPEVPIAILLHGLQGEVTVKGVKYNGVMMQYGTGQAMTDQEIAEVVTYIRTNLGNKATPVTLKDVAAAKAKHAARKKPFSEAELRALMK